MASASEGRLGGSRCLAALRLILSGCRATVIPNQLALSFADQAYDDRDTPEARRRQRGAAGDGAPIDRRCATHDDEGRRSLRRYRRARGVAEEQSRHAREPAPPPSIVALDLPSVTDAEGMVARLGDSVTFYKIGMELTYAGGLSLAEALVAERQESLHRPQAARHPQHGGTCRPADRQARRQLPTVHAYPQSMKAALAGVAARS